MTAVHALVCDHQSTTTDPPHPGAPLTFTAPMHTTGELLCPAQSRTARSPILLSVIAERDGWTTTANNRHLCPAHAVAQSGAVA